MNEAAALFFLDLVLGYALWGSLVLVFWPLLTLVEWRRERRRLAAVARWQARIEENRE